MDDTQTTPTDAATTEQVTVTPETPDYAAENARLTAELEKQRSEFAALNAKHADMVRRAELEGKVSDIGLALKVLDPEKHLNSDGSVNLYAVYDEFPGLKPPLPAATAPNGGGGLQYPIPDNDLERAARTGDPFTINSAFDTLLKGGRK